MWIENVDAKESLKSVGIRLTRAEASELRDSIEALLADGADHRHEHVATADYQTEITIWLEPETA